MSLDVGDALTEGADRSTDPNGVLLMVGFAAVGFASLVVQHSYLSWAIDEGILTDAMVDMLPPDPAPLAVEMSVAATIGLLAGTALVAEGLRIVAIRTFVSEHTSRIPATLATRRIGWAVLNGFVGGIVVNLLIVVGGLLLVLPGVFVALSLFFVRQVIAVEDEHFVDAMSTSWDLAKGNRVELAVLGIVWLTLAVAIWIVNGVVGLLLSSAPAVAATLSPVLGAPLSVFGVAVGARAYVQLADGRDDAADEGTRQDGVDDGEEWPDPPGLEI